MQAARQAEAVPQHQAPKKVVVLGAGLMGVTTAYFLNRNGVEVTVLDHNPMASTGTSYANAGLLSPSQCDPRANPWDALHFLRSVVRTALRRESRVDADTPPPNKLKLTPELLFWGTSYLLSSGNRRFRRNADHQFWLAEHSRDLTERLVQEHNMDIGWRWGSVLILDDPAHWKKALASERAKMERVGCPVEFWDKGKLLAEEPFYRNLPYPVAGVLYNPRNATADSRRFCTLLAAICKNRGVRFEYNVHCQSLALSADGTEIKAVKAADGRTFEGDAFLVCLGPWSRPFLRASGITHARVPIIPMKGHSVTISTADVPPEDAPQHCLALEQYYTYTTPFDGRLRATMGTDFVGWDTNVDPEKAGFLTRYLRKIVNADAHPERPNPADSAMLWTGLRPVTPDFVPMIGRLPFFKNLYINAGHGTVGWTLSTASSKLVSDLITFGKPVDFPEKMDHQAFAPDRFSRSPLAKMRAQLWSWRHLWFGTPQQAAAAPTFAPATGPSHI